VASGLNLDANKYSPQSSSVGKRSQHSMIERGNPAAAPVKPSTGADGATRRRTTHKSRSEVRARLTAPWAGW
jgi:hypothetical protein